MCVCVRALGEVLTCRTVVGGGGGTTRWEPLRAASSCEQLFHPGVLHYFSLTEQASHLSRHSVGNTDWYRIYAGWSVYGCRAIGTIQTVSCKIRTRCSKYALSTSCPLPPITWPGEPCMHIRLFSRQQTDISAHTLILSIDTNDRDFKKTKCSPLCRQL